MVKITIVYRVFSDWFILKAYAQDPKRTKIQDDQSI